MSGSWPLLFVALAICLLLIGTAAWLVLNGSTYGAPGGRHAATRPPRSAFSRTAHEQPATKKRAAIVINPTKFDDVEIAKAELIQTSRDLDWEDPLFLETTIEQTGAEQAREALAEKVDLVCALGGDGTIRAVASVLMGTRTPMGLLPRGTGNLLARNLDVPFGDVTAGLRVACTGRNRAIDVAWVELDPEVAEVDLDERGADEPAPSPEVITDESVATTEVTRHPFLVMAGMGFDAAIMDGTSEELKSSVGWTAYFVTGIRSLFFERFAVRVRADGSQMPTKKVRTVVFGNCGTLTGGIQLMPAAQIDDGVLDCVFVAPKSLFGWSKLAATVLRKSEKETSQLTRSRGSDFIVEVDDPKPVQIDGDVLGEARRLHVGVNKQSLIVRTGAGR